MKHKSGTQHRNLSIVLVIVLAVIIAGFFLFRAVYALQLPYFMSPLPVIVPPIESLPDARLFEATDCSQSCWQGLRPGQSTGAEVENYFAQYVSYNPEFNKRQIDEEIVLYTGSHRDGYSLQAFVQNDILLSLDLTGPFAITLAEITNALGNHSYTNLIVRQSTVDISKYADVTIFFPEQGYIFEFRMNTGVELENVSNEKATVCLDENDFPYRVIVANSGNIDAIMSDLQQSHYPSLTQNALETMIEGMIVDFTLGCMEANIE